MISSPYFSYTNMFPYTLLLPKQRWVMVRRGGAQPENPLNIKTPSLEIVFVPIAMNLPFIWSSTISYVYLLFNFIYFTFTSVH
jgi:hypothetical protein